jgi:hypothetical protein
MGMKINILLAVIYCSCVKNFFADLSKFKLYNPEEKR